MTVGELIAALSRFPDDKAVWINEADPAGNFVPHVSVALRLQDGALLLEDATPYAPSPTLNDIEDTALSANLRPHPFIPNGSGTCAKCGSHEGFAEHAMWIAERLKAVNYQKS